MTVNFTPHTFVCFIFYLINNNKKCMMKYKTVLPIMIFSLQDIQFL